MHSYSCIYQNNNERNETRHYTRCYYLKHACHNCETKENYFQHRSLKKYIAKNLKALK